ncbi:LysR family transcriptional regulator [Herbaspirillum sp. 1130]|uniref:LysR family transcriptional regulator n=1 Tax=Herbaspirillum sp. 1130 TaxID=2806562 RepID=UPI001AE15447|nr:LysR family transcriptional regulator [Herbaspirillum sp. 1130]MBP1317355.1 DNA-binding transcriptional LysR family regulator [Herbaspirillum sp. 1130]
MDTSQRVRAIISFVQAADSGSFAGAGRILGISSAAVSLNVAGLETALGVRLMNRTTRSLNLTEEGSAFLRQARIALDALEQATDDVVAARATPTGRVRISTSAAFGREQLLPLLPGLSQRYPALSVEVDFDDRLSELVQDGYDLAIRGGRIADSSLVSRSICKLNLALVASPAYLEARGTPRRPQDLHKHSLITRKFLGGKVSPWNFQGSDGSIMTWNTEHALLTLSSPEALVQAALAGMGIAEVGVHHAWRYLQRGRLKVLLLRSHHPGNYEMCLQYPHRALIAPRVRVAVDYLLEGFAASEELHVPLAALRKYAA